MRAQNAIESDGCPREAHELGRHAGRAIDICTCGHQRKNHHNDGSCFEIGYNCSCEKWIPQPQPVSDPVKPRHYKATNGIEAVDVVEGFALDYHCGNVVTYILRHAKKNGLEDLKKARWHLDREIANMEKAR